jgi:predicted ATPase
VRGVQIWRSGGIKIGAEEVTAPVVTCLCDEALSEWHFGEIAASHATMDDAISLAKQLNDMHGLAVALFFAGFLANFERNAAEVERLASDLIELSARHNFAFWLAGGAVLRGWARSALGDKAEGISWIENGIGDYRATGSTLTMPFLLALKAEALQLADRTLEALDAITEAEALAERSEERWWCAELQRLRGMFLMTIGADETQIEASFRQAVSTARGQKSASLVTRAQVTYAQYRCRKERT